MRYIVPISDHNRGDQRRMDFRITPGLRNRDGAMLKWENLMIDANNINTRYANSLPLSSAVLIAVQVKLGRMLIDN